MQACSHVVCLTTSVIPWPLANGDFRWDLTNCKQKTGRVFTWIPPPLEGGHIFLGTRPRSADILEMANQPIGKFQDILRAELKKVNQFACAFWHQTFLHLAVEMWQEFLRISEEYQKSKFSVGMRRLVASWLVRERRMAWFWDVTCGGHCLLQIAWLWLSHPQSLMEQNPLPLLYTSPPETKRNSTIHI